MIHFKILDPRYTEDALGLIPEFLTEIDPRPAAEQFNERYAHGGGWQPQYCEKFVMSGDPLAPTLKYPGDPEMKPIAVGALRHECIYLYPSAFVAIVQPNSDYEVSRMD